MCPYCDQGRIKEAIVKKTKELIYICEECDTVWATNETISDSTGIVFDLYAKTRGFAALWSELEILKDNIIISDRLR